MHFLHQIITSSHVYTLYEEDGHIFLHVLNLRTEESTDVFGDTILMDVLNEDPEVTLDNIIEVHDIIITVLTSN